MSRDIKKVITLWKEEISDHIHNYSPYQVSQQLKQMAAFFSPGLCYCYVMNFHNLGIEYVDGNTSEILGISPDNFTMQKLLTMLPQEELQVLEKKEALVADFLFRFLAPEQLPVYKVVYFFRVQDMNGDFHTMLHQATTLTVSDTGRVEHVLGIQTDVSHLHLAKNNHVSFISLDGKTSYFNLDPQVTTTFDPTNANLKEKKLSSILTPRELEIVKLMAKGLNTEAIAEEIHLSINTVRTHRKNILRRTGCNNATEVIARCVIEGVV